MSRKEQYLLKPEQLTMSQALWMANTYKKVFWSKPWNEALVDENGKFKPWNPKNSQTWSELGLRRAYPLKDTREYILDETGQAESRIAIIPDPQNSKRIIAFGWGYGFPDLETLAAKKWPNDAEKVSEILNNTQLNGEVWYLSEVGVLPKWQSNGMGTGIVEGLLTSAPSRPVIMRTNIDSPMVYIAEKYDFTPVIAPTTGRYQDLILPTDPTNDQRVLYIREAT